MLFASPFLTGVMTGTARFPLHPTKNELLELRPGVPSRALSSGSSSINDPSLVSSADEDVARLLAVSQNLSQEEILARIRISQTSVVDQQDAEGGCVLDQLFTICLEPHLCLPLTSEAKLLLLMSSMSGLNLSVFKGESFCCLISITDPL